MQRKAWRIWAKALGSKETSCDKEADRIAILVRELRKLGLDITEKDDGMIINPPTTLRGAEMDSEEEYHMDNAERDGIVAGAAQAAQQNYLQKYAPQAAEAPTGDAPNPNAQ